MKAIIYGLMFLLVIGTVYAECIPKEKFIDRLKDKCKVEDGICDDAESLLFDKDCMIDVDALSCRGDRCVFEEIWFAKLVIIALVFMLIRHKKDYSIFIIIGVLYLIATFIPLDILGEPNIIEPKVNTSVQISDEAMNDNILYKFGSKVMPSNPIIGIVIIVVALFLIFRTTFGYMERWRRY